MASSNKQIHQKIAIRLMKYFSDPAQAQLSFFIMSSIGGRSFCLLRGSRKSRGSEDQILRYCTLSLVIVRIGGVCVSTPVSSFANSQKKDGVLPGLYAGVWESHHGSFGRSLLVERCIHVKSQLSPTLRSEMQKNTGARPNDAPCTPIIQLHGH